MGRRREGGKGIDDQHEKKTHLSSIIHLPFTSYRLDSLYCLPVQRPYGFLCEPFTLEVEVEAEGVHVKVAELGCD